MTTNEDPPINPAVAGTVDPMVAPAAVKAPETSAEGIARLGRDKVGYHHDPDDPLLTSADTLTAAVKDLRRAVNRRTAMFVSVLVVDVILTVAISVLGYRSEHFLTCQIAQNTQFRAAATTERAAQRTLLNVILNPTSTPADRAKATQDYYTGLVASDQQRTAVGGC